MHQNAEPNVMECSICRCEFEIQLEGGIAGYIGIIPVQLCPMCHSGLDMLYTEIHGCYEEEEEDDD